MGTRDILDAISAIEAALDNIRRVIDEARDGQGRVNPDTVDLDAIERYRDDYQVAFDYYHDSYGY